MLGTKRVTLKEVAREAGVSTQTVSRVVNKNARVAVSTRERVQAVIDRTGYRPNANARALISGRTNLIGIICSGIGFYGPSQIVVGVEEEANRLGYSLNLRLIREASHESMIEAIHDLISQGVAAVVWAAEGRVDVDYKFLISEFSALNIPIILTDVYSLDEINTVLIDNYRGGCVATQHLIDQGYQTIATITGPQMQWSAVQRFRGWRDTLEKAGFSAETNLTAEGDWSPESGEKCYHQLMQQRPDIDAIFVGNDEMAIAVMKAAVRNGKRIPEDLGVVGSDDIPTASYMTPSLTTVSQDIIELGRRCMHKLHTQLETPDGTNLLTRDTICLAPKLIVRKSTLRNAHH